MGAWGHDGDKSKFFWMIYFLKNFFHRMIQIISFSHWHQSMGEGSDYLIRILFLIYIFLLGQDRGDGSI